ncbi:hypothetical protein LTS07_001823 [Exophiala sideris]|uniref:BZIP domain-containing protein n=1 Tax=Exophiala sideris TaxID=1016849 RepID=A0ABR0JPE4_9EURO|nr:hypothetical protein LTS07_001823 [Exophiala sideris]KAK5044337.1 hypothetical protein LTR13_000693 [Exophiala sideris]KAK5067837.1 hypothetical protein LTR69_001826 [Exophiala sideris]
MPISNTTVMPVTQEKESVRYKRKLTDARREQNRRSQRIWREKQKQLRDEEIRTKVQDELKRLTAQSTPEDLQPIQAFPNHEEASQVDAPPTHDICLPDPILPSLTALYYFVPPDLDVEDMRCMWAVPADTGLKMYIPPPTKAPLILSPLTVSGSGYGNSSPNTSTPFSLSSRSATSQTRASASTSTLPSPYLNNLSLVGESCFAATLSIATTLGITRASYVNDHPSPFAASSTLDLHTMPSDLRPTAYQLILPHPCYLDCIPFPHFRSMAIYLSSLARLDHCALFLDIMHDGLVCWGRERANGAYGRSMRDGVAWNRRSWEVKRWFWRKWGWIAAMSVEDIDAGVDVPHAHDDVEVEVDDEDGMLSGSQWWWALQDDEEGRAPAHVQGGQSVAPEAAVEEELGSYLSRRRICNVGIRQTNEKHMLYQWDGVKGNVRTQPFDLP